MQDKAILTAISSPGLTTYFPVLSFVLGMHDYLCPDCRSVTWSPYTFNFDPIVPVPGICIQKIWLIPPICNKQVEITVIVKIVPGNAIWVWTIICYRKMIQFYKFIIPVFKKWIIAIVCNEQVEIPVIVKIGPCNPLRKSFILNNITRLYEFKVKIICWLIAAGKSQYKNNWYKSIFCWKIHWHKTSI